MLSASSSDSSDPVLAGGLHCFQTDHGRTVDTSRATASPPKRVVHVPPAKNRQPLCLRQPVPVECSPHRRGVTISLLGRAGGARPRIQRRRRSPAGRRRCPCPTSVKQGSSKLLDVLEGSRPPRTSARDQRLAERFQRLDLEEEQEQQPLTTWYRRRQRERCESAAWRAADSGLRAALAELQKRWRLELGQRRLPGDLRLLGIQRVRGRLRGRHPSHPGRSWPHRSPVLRPRLTLRQTKRILDALGLVISHSRVRKPAGRGKIERFFRTVRQQFLAPLDTDQLAGIADLDQRFHTWLESEYHRSPHRGLKGTTPLETWLAKCHLIVPVDAAVDLAEAFRHEAARKVHRDSTITLDGVLFELPSTLIGERVVLRYDPTLPPSNRRLFVHHGGRHVGEARLVDSYANARVRRADLRLDPAADDDNRLQDD